MPLQRNPHQIRHSRARHQCWVRALYIVCALTLIPSLFMHPHAEFSFAELPAFPALLAFMAGCILVLVAQLVRWLLMRPDDYYNSRDS